MQALHRMRSQCVRDRTALSNSTRELLGEYGMILAKGIAYLRKKIPELLEDAENGLSFRKLPRQVDLTNGIILLSTSKNRERREAPIPETLNSTLRALPSRFKFDLLAKAMEQPAQNQ